MLSAAPRPAAVPALNAFKSSPRCCAQTRSRCVDRLMAEGEERRVSDQRCTVLITFNPREGGGGWRGVVGSGWMKRGWVG